MQTGTESTSTASFNGQAAGKPGFTSIRSMPLGLTAMEELRLADSDVRQAAEVVLGRLDIAELVGGPQVQAQAAEVPLSLVMV